MEDLIIYNEHEYEDEVIHKYKLHVRLTDQELSKSRSQVHVLLSGTNLKHGDASLMTLCDERMGPRMPGEFCKICKLEFNKCVGKHYGYIELPEPVFYRHWIPHLKQVLKKICYNCQKQHAWKKNSCGASKTNCQAPIKIDISERTCIIYSKTNQQSYTAKAIYDLLSNLPEITLTKIGFSLINHPKNLIARIIPVLPNLTRPYAFNSHGKVYCDAKTNLYHKILQACEDVRREHVVTVKNELITRLYYEVNMLYDSSTKGNRSSDENHQDGAILSMLAGKDNLFRETAIGKICNYQGRGVIIGDPYLKCDQVGVPVNAITSLTVEVIISRFNIEDMQILILKNKVSVVHIVSGKFQGSYEVNEHTNINQLAKRLFVGCKVERHLQNGDRIIFNRQPTLHAAGMTSFEAVILPDNAFHLHPSATSIFAADFDGDDMNIHVPRSIHTQTEQSEIMNVEQYIVGANGKAQFGLIHNAIRTCYELSLKSTFLTKEEFFNTCMPCHLNRITEMIPAIIMPKTKECYYTGLQVLNCALSRNIDDPCYLDEGDIKQLLPVFSPEEELVIRNSQIMCGTITSKHLGNKGSFIKKVWQKSPKESINFITRLQRITNVYSDRRGFSLGVEDCMFFKDKIPKMDANEKNPAKRFDEMKAAVDASLFSKLDNAFRSMSISGARGNILNAQYMVCMIGHRYANGGNITKFFRNKRTFSCIEEGKENIFSMGYVPTNYNTGMDPLSFMVVQWDARSGVVARVISTSEIGYLNKKLGQMLSSLSIHYDNSVRDHNGKIIQFRYGYDGIDAQKQYRNKIIYPILNKELIDKYGTDLCCINEVHMPTHCNVKFPNNLVYTNELFIEEYISNPNKLHKLIQEEIQQKCPIQFQIMLKRLFIAPLLVHYTLDEIKLKVNEYIDCILKNLVTYCSPVGLLAAHALSEPCVQATMGTMHGSGDKKKAIASQSTPRLQELLYTKEDIAVPVVQLKCAHTPWLIASYGYKKHWISKIEVVNTCSIRKIWHDDFEELFEDVFPINEPHIHITFDRGYIPDCFTHIHMLMYFESKGFKNTRMRISHHLYEEQYEMDIHTIDIDIIHKMFNEENVLGDIELKSNGMTHAVIRTPFTFQWVMSNINYVDHKFSYSTHVMDVYKTLGIEAARQVLFEEIRKIDVFTDNVDIRHVLLLCDRLCSEGVCLPVSFTGVQETGASFMHKVTFERQKATILNSALEGLIEECNDVASAEMIGTRIPLGTGGAFEIKQFKQIKLI
jgi:DNA-directed RNA polymerase beta' subunit